MIKVSYKNTITKTKRIKSKYVYEIKYIENNKRVHNFLKTFYILSYRLSKVKYKKRLLNFFIECLMNYKNSNLRYYKILTLKYLVSSN